MSGTCSLTECSCNQVLCICIGHLEIEFLNDMTCRQGTTILGLEPALLLSLCIQILDSVEEKNLSYFSLEMCHDLNVVIGIDNIKGSCDLIY